MTENELSNSHRQLSNQVHAQDNRLQLTQDQVLVYGRQLLLGD